MSLPVIIIDKPVSREMIELAAALADIIASIDKATVAKPSNRMIEAIRDEAYTRGVKLIGHEQMDQFVVFMLGGA